MTTVRWRNSWTLQAFQVPRRGDDASMAEVAGQIDQALGSGFTVKPYTAKSNIYGIRVYKHGTGRVQTAAPGTRVVVRKASDIARVGSEVFVYPEAEYRARFTELDPDAEGAKRKAVEAVAELLGVSIKGGDDG